MEGFLGDISCVSFVLVVGYQILGDRKRDNKTLDDKFEGSHRNLRPFMAQGGKGSELVFVKNLF